MKTIKFFFTFLLLLTSVLSNAQDSDPNVGNVFIANESVIAYVYEEASKNPEAERFILARDYRIKILDRISVNNISYYMVRVYNYYYGDDNILSDFASNKEMAATIKRDISLSEEAELKVTAAEGDKQTLSQNLSYANEIKVFKISTSVNGSTAYKLSRPQATDNLFLIKVNDLHSFKSYYKKWERFVNASYINVPAKIRFQPIDLVQNFNLGLNGDLKMRCGQSANSYVGFVFGINIAGTDFNKAEFTNNTSLTASGKLFIFSPNLGVYYQYKSLQFVFGTGWDYMSKDYGKDWDYQGKPNFLFGVGTNLISSDKPSTSSIEAKEIRK